MVWKELEGVFIFNQWEGDFWKNLPISGLEIGTSRFEGLGWAQSYRKTLITATILPG